MKTDRQTGREQTENSITEATLIPVDCRGEQANYGHTCSVYNLSQSVLPLLFYHQ